MGHLLRQSMREVVVFMNLYLKVPDELQLEHELLEEQDSHDAMQSTHPSTVKLSTLVICVWKVFCGHVLRHVLL